MDFIAEVERTFKMLDGAVLILSAKEGIQAQTKLLFSTLQKLQIPTIIFINKIDRASMSTMRTATPPISRTARVNLIAMQLFGNVCG